MAWCKWLCEPPVVPCTVSVAAVAAVGVGVVLVLVLISLLLLLLLLLVVVVVVVVVVCGGGGGGGGGGVCLDRFRGLLLSRLYFLWNKNHGGYSPYSVLTLWE